MFVGTAPLTGTSHQVTRVVRVKGRREAQKVLDAQEGFSRRDGDPQHPYLTVDPASGRSGVSDGAH